VGRCNQGRVGIPSFGGSVGRRKCSKSRPWGFGLTGLVAERLLRGTVVPGVMHDNVRGGGSRGGLIQWDPLEDFWLRLTIS